MTDTRPIRRLLILVAAFCAAWMCLCSSHFERSACAQMTEPAEWANDNPQDVVVVNETSTEPNVTGPTEPVSPTRTPIDRSQTAATDRNSSGDARSTSWAWAWLPIVLASALWWLVHRLRRGKSLDHSLLPEGVIVPLGRRAVGGGQTVQLIRIGSRILVVTPTAEGLRTLTEITDPQEVERIVSLCLQPQQGMAGIGSLFSGRPIRSLADSDRPQPRTTGTAVESSRNLQADRAVHSPSARAGHAAPDHSEVTR